MDQPVLFGCLDSNAPTWHGGPPTNRSIFPLKASQCIVPNFWQNDEVFEFAGMVDLITDELIDECVQCEVRCVMCCDEIKRTLVQVCGRQHISLSDQVAGGLLNAKR